MRVRSFWRAFCMRGACHFEETADLWRGTAWPHYCPTCGTRTYVEYHAFYR
jgi:hypothetical protein